MEPDDPHFEVALPPQTALYTSSEVLLMGLGFSGAPNPGPRQSTKPDKVTKEIGGRQRRVMTTDCWGFFNEHATKTLVVRGDRMLPGQNIDTNLPDDVPIPATMQLQAELLPMGRVFVSIPRRRPTDQDSLLMGLEALLEKVRTACNLRSTQIEVTKGQGTSVMVSNHTYPQSKTRLSFVLGGALAQALSIPEDWKITFDLAFPRQVIIQATGGRLDPFRGRYPISILARSHGHARSYVEGGRGYTTMVALWEERRPLQVVDMGIDFEANETFLDVEFLDGKRNTVAFESTMEAQLVVAFSRVA